MARTDNQMRAEQITDPSYLVLDTIHRTMDQDLLRVNTPEEGYPLPKIPCKRRSVHVQCSGLKRVQALDAGIRKTADDVVNGTARMKQYLVAMPACLLGKLDEPGEDEVIEVRRADDEFALCPEIVAKEVTIYLSACFAKEPFIGFKIESADMFKGCFHDCGMGMQFDHKLFHPEKIHHIVKKGGPESAGTIDLSGVRQFTEGLLEMQVLVAGPVMRLHIPDGFCARKRSRFAQRAFVLPCIEEAFSFRMPVCGFHVLGGDPP